MASIVMCGPGDRHFVQPEESGNPLSRPCAGKLSEQGSRLIWKMAGMAKKWRMDKIMDRLSKMLGAGFMASSLLFVGTSAFAVDGEIKSDLKELRQDQKNCARIIERFAGTAGSCAAISKSLKETAGNYAATSRAARVTQRSRRIEKRFAAVEERSKATDTHSGGITGQRRWRQTRAATRYQRL